MQDGFIRVGAATPDIQVADCHHNAEQIIKLIDKAVKEGIQLLVFPELCVTGYTCSDLFLQESLLCQAKEALIRIAEATQDKDIVAVVGLPLMVQSKLFNTAAVLSGGKILGIVPKTHLPNYSEFYEARHFAKGNQIPIDIQIGTTLVPFGTNILFKCRTMESFVLGIEICEDLWVPAPPSISHVAAGATVIANLSASDEVTGKDIYRRKLVTGQSERLICGYIYADAGEGESTTDLVFGGHNLIMENGSLLAESERFKNQMILADMDLYKLVSERRRINTHITDLNSDYLIVEFDLVYKTLNLIRQFDSMPFVPSDMAEREARCEEILMIQALGLKKRLKHTRSEYAVIGISGGLDSTLALLVTVKAFDMLAIKRANIIAVTMPCFGTTDRTYHNACELVRCLGATLLEVDIKEAVMLHFRDIGHNPNCHDVTYENSQARERTQALMDIANRYNGLVVGTGDMSELALGWATYNGDHMSMYGVNASVPKTLVRHLVEYYADSAGDSILKKTLIDVLNTPVSPELLPPNNGEIVQKTEDLVGPYELHDFYLFHMLRYGSRPSRIYRLASNAFKDIYDKQTILKWLKVFCRRFIQMQFKRSCLPDGPKVGSVAISPRGDLRMPSDASVRAWMEELENITDN